MRLSPSGEERASTQRTAFLRSLGGVGGISEGFNTSGSFKAERLENAVSTMAAPMRMEHMEELSPSEHVHYGALCDSDAGPVSHVV